jgi:hypothetical protein
VQDARITLNHQLAVLFKIWRQGRKLGTGRRSRWVPGIIFPRQLRDDEVETPFVTFFCATGQGPFALYRRSVYARTQGWDPAIWPHEGTDMFCQMALLSKVHYLRDRLYLKRVQPSQGMSNGLPVQQSYARFRAKWDNLRHMTRSELVQRHNFYG